MSGGLNDFDPLSVLRADDVGVQPDPDFGARLRVRLEQALSIPEGIDVSGTAELIEELAADETTVEPYAVPRSAILPYLAVSPAREAIDWYTDALGASVASEPIIMADGRVGHAELAIGDGVFYLADEFPEMGLRGPAAGAVSVSLMLHVADTDAAVARARKRGAAVERDVDESYGSRRATVIDPFGHRWMLSGPPLALLQNQIQRGDIGYVSLWTVDAGRAAAFYGHLLGWRYDPDSRQVTNLSHRLGIYATGVNTLFCCYAVDDLAATRHAILRAGGQVDEPERFDFGTVMGGTDSAGAAFAVYVPGPGDPRPPLNGSGHGELSYVTYEVADSARFREFYADVLGWTYEGGRIDDGWEALGVHPMSGIAGGSAATVTVPMWTVDDIDAAVARVREAGGTVIDEPSQQSYGISAQCTDDQGGRFYLGEF